MEAGDGGQHLALMASGQMPSQQKFSSDDADEDGEQDYLQVAKKYERLPGRKGSTPTDLEDEPAETLAGQPMQKNLHFEDDEEIDQK